MFRSCRCVLAIILACLAMPCVAAADGPQWIWSGPSSEDGETILFRRVIDRKSDQPVFLSLTCDNEYSLFVNGDRVGDSRGDGRWQQMDGYRIDALLKPGRNVIAVRARNIGGVAGLVVAIRDGAGPAAETLSVSDRNWVWNANYAPGWATSPAVDRSWKPAHEFGPAGTTAPWGALNPVAADAFVVATPRERIERKTLADEDLVVLLGGTFIERAQRFGFVETALTRRLPGRGVRFRNLGWSGDTVWAESRGIFDPPAKGYARMIEQIRQLEPDWVIVNYGQNESFGGRQELPAFLGQLNLLVEELRDTGATVVLAGPMRQVDMPAPLPPLGNRNEMIDEWSDAVAEFARSNGLGFVPMQDLLEQTQAAAERMGMTASDITANGLHMNETGYWLAADLFAPRLLQALGHRSPSVDDGLQTEVTRKLGNGSRWQQKEARLPAPQLHGRKRDLHQVRIAGLPTGRFELLIDGQVTAVATQQQWGKGVAIGTSPSLEESERLRQLILQKNELYFHHWRPQNITYLFLFRKHEQGNNAVEVEQFKQLVAEVEQQIAKWNTPRERRYELRKVALRGQER